MIHMHVAFDHDLLKIPQTQRKPEVTPHAQDDDLRFEMSPFEQRWPLSSHEAQA
jgi:hypothetical protein